MIKEALQYIVGLGKAEEHMINGACYSDKPLHRIDTYYPKADAIEMHTEFACKITFYISNRTHHAPGCLVALHINNLVVIHMSFTPDLLFHIF